MERVAETMEQAGVLEARDWTNSPEPTGMCRTAQKRGRENWTKEVPARQPEKSVRIKAYERKRVESKAV